MITPSPARHAPLREQLANWLALLALLALGIVWPLSDAPRSAAPGAPRAPLTVAAAPPGPAPAAPRSF